MFPFQLKALITTSVVEPFFLWIFHVSFLPKTLITTLVLNNVFSPMCISLYLRRPLARLKDLSQWLHLKGFLPVCTLSYIRSFPARVKHLLQWSHLKGFTPVCSLKASLSWKRLFTVTTLVGSLVCILSCWAKIHRLEKRLVAVLALEGSICRMHTLM